MRKCHFVKKKKKKNHNRCHIATDAALRVFFPSVHCSRFRKTHCTCASTSTLPLICFFKGFSGSNHLWKQKKKRFIVHWGSLQLKNIYVRTPCGYHQLNCNQLAQDITICVQMSGTWRVSSQESVCWLWKRLWLCWILWSADWRAASPAGPGGQTPGSTEPRLHPASEKWKQQMALRSAKNILSTLLDMT